MKLSIAWIFDHINAEYKDVDMPALINLFNERVAELEGFYTNRINIESLFLGQVVSITETQAKIFMPELNKEVAISIRSDVQPGQWYVLKQKGDGFGWANESDFGSEKDSLLPQFTSDEQDAKGGWKSRIPEVDYIIEIDNKSITHRPDMWGHRGFAREIALLLNLSLKPLNDMITQLPVQEFEKEVPATAQQPFSARIIEPGYINRFAFAYFSDIKNVPSLTWMAARLARVGLRTIDTLVDMTNYVMCDIGQPVHAFDANKISAKHFEVRLANPHEKIILLDEEVIELTEKDIVITDGTKPISLAGVMGGRDTQIQADTMSMVLESAHFNATMVRESASRHKKRTEASARFEKTLDPNQNIAAIERFVRLLQDAEISYKVSGVASIGLKAQELSLNIEHDYIENRLGLEVSSDRIMQILLGLGFQATEKTLHGKLTYHVQVPTFRSTKDIKIKEDILEEIGRGLGYTNIPLLLPEKETKPSPLHHVYALRRIKQLLAYGCAMREVSNYSFYDEDFLRQLNWQPLNPISVQSPVSENWKSLVSSLIPGLLKSITQNSAEHDQLSFFEWGRIWHKDQDAVIEQKQLAGISYNKSDSISFYHMQSMVEQVAHMIRLPLTWQKVNEPSEPWFAPYQTAHMMYGDIRVGTLGVLDIAFTHRVLSGHMVAFVIDGNFLENFYGVPVGFVAPSKYPSTRRDISMMVPLSVTVEQLKEMIKKSSEHIADVCLVDIFQKEDWIDSKSITFTFVMQDAHKTLTSSEADAIAAGVVKTVQALGAQVR